MNVPWGPIANVMGEAAKSMCGGFLGAMMGMLRWVCVLLVILDGLEMARSQFWRTHTSP